MGKFMLEIEAAIKGKAPVIYLQCPEEKRVISIISDIAKKFAKKTLSWDCLNGLTGFPADTKDASIAIKALTTKTEEAFYIFRDFSEFFNNPQYCRALKDFSLMESSGEKQIIFITGTEKKIPENIEKIIYLISIPPPDKEEIRKEFAKIAKTYPHNTIDPSFTDEIINSLTGLSMPEVEAVIHRIFKSEIKDREEFFDMLFTEKQAMIRKSGYLEFTPPRIKIDSMGGLSNLKEWLIKRQKIFSKEAVEADIPIPKGLLMMGVSGCGKSMAVKIIPSLWKVPLYRLDMNLIFSGIFGSPEATFHNALRSLESVAPAILWIDEIENAMGMDEGGIKISSQIFSSFLTWMQEKPPLIFIAATANRIQALPAEVIRKGRFDQIFFVDLPTENERREIFKIYLQKYKADISKFDLKMLGILTKGWNGAEIEQVVSEARTDAFYENRMFCQADITNNINKTVPLSTTMEAQIKAIRS
ncbi:MAG TPA: AAA family ATPase [Victivallales bacterium]|nr:AAA family ATPase [Victivallales bacterium]